MGTDPISNDGLTEDAFLAGRLRLRQFRRGHRAGHDAILLASAVTADAGERVVEFGAGAGAAGLALAGRVEGIDLTLVEIDPAKRAAHLDEGETLDVCVKAARRILKPGGCLTLIWRADELDRVLKVIGCGFGAVVVVSVFLLSVVVAFCVLVW